MEKWVVGSTLGRAGGRSSQLSHFPILLGVLSPDRQLNGRSPIPQSPCHLSHRDPRHGLHSAISCNTQLPLGDPAAFDFFLLFKTRPDFAMDRKRKNL